MAQTPFWQEFGKILARLTLDQCPKLRNIRRQKEAEFFPDFDDSSWDIYEEAVDELLDEQCEILAEFEGNF